MESRTFIRTAQALIKQIEDFKAANLTGDEEQAQGQALQKEVNAAFTGLQNPTLPSAEKLLDLALHSGFSVNPKVVQAIEIEVRRCWGN